MASDSPKPKGAVAWNDPPMFTYDIQVQGGMSSKLNLTKRISFPLASDVSSQSASPPINPTSGPPLGSHSAGHSLFIGLNSPTLHSNVPNSTKLSGTPSHTPMGKVPSKQLMSSEISSTDVSFEDIYTNIELQLEDFSKNNERTAADIKKKIQILETMWNENKFNSQTKCKILELSKAIKEKNAKAGLELQRSLMVDHAVICGQWIPAFRQLLNFLSSDKSDPL